MSKSDKTLKTAWILSDCEPLPCDDNPRLMRAGQLAEYLSEHDWNVVWWAPGFNHGIKKDRFDSTRQIKVNKYEALIALHSPVVYKKNTSIKRIIFYKFLASELKKSFQKNVKPDIILCSWPTQNFAKIAIQYGKKHNVPVILDVRDLWPDIFTRVFPEKFQNIARVALIPLLQDAKRLFKKADSIIGVTPSSLKWGLKKANRKIRTTDKVIYIGYKDQPIESIKNESLETWKKLGVDKNTWNVTYFGTFSESTLDMKTCITAFNRFASEHKDARFIICGNGDAAEKFKTLAHGNEQIIFPGWCSNEQIQSLLSISDVGLYPFKNLEDFKDAFGNKIIGYMAAGISVLTSLQGFSKKYIKKYEFGDTYEEGDVDSCYRALHSFYDNKIQAVEMGKRARIRFEKDFDMPVVNEQFVQLFKELIDNNTL